MYKYLIDGNEVDNIINPAWSDDLDNFANSFSFSTYGIYQTGSIFQILKDGATVLIGVITDLEQSEKNVFQYSGFDFGFYINQNEIIEQFKKIKISEAIRKLCNNYQIPVGNIPEMSSTVTEIFKDKKLSDVISELLKLAKTKGAIKDVYYTCSKGKFEILPYTTINNLSGEMGTIFSIESQLTINQPTIHVSIQELKNRVIVTDNASDKIVKQVKAEDTDSISKYGLLQEVETVDTSKTNNLAKIASDKLKELNKVSKTITVSMLGDYRMHKGVIMPIDCPEYGVKGNFLIKSSKHTINGTSETVNVTLEMRD